MTDDQTRIRRIIEKLSSVSGRISIENIKRIANICKFEVFDEEPNAEGIKRVSLGGSLILIDIDLEASTEVVKGAYFSHAQVQGLFSKSGNVEQNLLESLQKYQTLDHFRSVFSLLAKWDRLSVGSVDCFRSLDGFADMLTKIGKKIEEADNTLKYDGPFGEGLINYGGKIGVSMRYWVSTDETEFLATFSYRESSGATNSKYRVCNMNEWIGSEFKIDLADGTIEGWNPMSDEKSTRAECILQLEPPLAIPLSEAKKLNASYLPKAVSLSGQPIDANSLTARRYRRPIYLPNDEVILLNYECSEILPGELVSVDAIPFSHPKEIPAILRILRKSAMIAHLWKSLCKEEWLVSDSNSEDELLLADFLLDDNHSANDDKDATSKTPVQLTLAMEKDIVIKVVIPGKEISPMKVETSEFSSRVSFVVDNSDPNQDISLLRAVQETNDLGIVIASRLRAANSNAEAMDIS